MGESLRRVEVGRRANAPTVESHTHSYQGGGVIVGDSWA